LKAIEAAKSSLQTYVYLLKPQCKTVLESKNFLFKIIIWNLQRIWRVFETSNLKGRLILEVLLKPVSGIIFSLKKALFF